MLQIYPDLPFAFLYEGGLATVRHPNTLQLLVLSCFKVLSHGHFQDCWKSGTHFICSPCHYRDNQRNTSPQLCLPPLPLPPLHQPHIPKPHLLQHPATTGILPSTGEIVQLKSMPVIVSSALNQARQVVRPSEPFRMLGHHSIRLHDHTPVPICRDKQH